MNATREGIFSWESVRANFKAPKLGFLFIPRNVSKEGCSHRLAPCCYLIPRKYPLPRASLFSLYLHSALRLATSPPPWCSYWQLLLSLLPPEWITTERLWKPTQKLQLAQCGSVHLPKGTGKPRQEHLLSTVCPGYLITSVTFKVQPQRTGLKLPLWRLSPPLQHHHSRGMLIS